jgi:hypothetical protein
MDQPPIVIHLTPPQLEAARLRLAQAGVLLNGYTGTTEGSGVKLAYSYDGVGVLSLTVLDKPWYLPMVVVVGHIMGWFQEAGT